MHTKTFGIGLSRTGTTSLFQLMSFLGYHPIHFSNELLLDPNSDVADYYDVIIDAPVPLLYKKLDKKYKNSKFILTTRNKKDWLASMKWLFSKGNNNRNFPHATLKYYKEFYHTTKYVKKILSDTYDSYHSEVIQYFNNRKDDLLVLNIDEEIKVSDICDFLNIPRKDISFPKVNKRHLSIEKESETVVQVINKEELYGTHAFPPGHFYSPIASVNEIRERENEIWAGVADKWIKDIDINTEGQISLLKELSEYYPEIPFEDNKKGDLRYFFNNVWFCQTDAILLYSMMRHFKPKRIIEIGSGVSSALMLDTNDLFLNKKTSLTFIEPNPERLYGMISEEDRKKTNIIAKPVQHADITIFEQLAKNDILFIDSSHVSKVGSDVNHIIFEILPRLKSGVLIHFHDIYYPFEYPKSWVLGGRNWNEDYLLKAFLMNNRDYQIRIFSEYLHLHHSTAFLKMPLCYKDVGCSLWMQKL